MRTKSLIGRITLIIAFVLLLPLSFAYVNYYHVSINTLMFEQKMSVDSSWRGVNGRIQGNLDALNRAFNDLTFKNEFSFFLNPETIATDKEYHYYIYSFSQSKVNLRSTYTHLINGIFVYSANERLKRENVMEHYDINELISQPYYKEIEKGPLNTVFFGKTRMASHPNSEFNLDKLNIMQNNEYVLPAYYKVEDLTTKKMVGVIEIDISIPKLFGGERQNLPPTAELAILNTNNDIIYSMGERVINTQNIIPIEQAMQRQTGSVRANNKTYNLYALSSPQLDDHIFMLLDQAQILKLLQHDMLKMFIQLIVILILVISLIYLTVRKSLSRLIILDHKMAEIESGNFNVQIKTDHYRDEISRVSQHFNAMARQLSESIAYATQKENARKEAELKALQSQINPHFLYNALENLRMQAEEAGFNKISETIVSLGELLRYSMDWEHPMVPLEKECENLRNYLNIMQLRYEQNLQCIVSLDPAANSIPVPKLILQPIIENCFDHAFKAVLPPWLIIVSTIYQDGELCINIQDNGSGMSAQRLDELSSSIKAGSSIPNRKGRSIGIVNVSQRLSSKFGDRSSISFASNPNMGTRVTIRLTPTKSIKTVMSSHSGSVTEGI